MRSGGGFKISVGTSSLLTIFVVLALTIFSVLGYVTANSDYKLANRTAKGITDYYVADSKAEDFLARLDQELYSYMEQVEEIKETGTVPESFATEEAAGEIRGLLQQGLSDSAFYRKAYGVVLGDFSAFSGVFKSDEVVLSENLLTTEFTVDDSRKLIMEIKLDDNPFESGVRYQVVKRALVSTMEYEEELLVS